MKSFAVISFIGIALLGGCATAPATPQPDAHRILQFEGRVQAIDTGCYVDGTCTATVDGVRVTTMSGERLGQPMWGEPNSLPAVGQRVAVRCLATGTRTCTLKGDRAYFLRVLP